ncbi:DUF6463 family protein [Microlunatus speluncae]|uniref:DUF6463 family protein n=1 Tax=Microlunatus speluncae TaxID=2594267 RepID=UPI00126639DA|nr:DUF6463 family protein [Microlunatus speluncae]
MIIWAGVLITLCGIGHTAGSLVMTVPRYGAAWLGLELWQPANADLVLMTPLTASFWFSSYSFGPLLLLVGLIVLWLGLRGITPPAFIAWALVGWTVVTTVLAGLSPLLLLPVAAVLLLVGAHRARRRGAAPAIPVGARVGLS